MKILGNFIRGLLFIYKQLLVKFILYPLYSTASSYSTTREYFSFTLLKN